MTYPYVAWSQKDLEIIACGPNRYRLLWQGRPVACFRKCSEAHAYARREFLA